MNMIDDLLSPRLNEKPLNKFMLHVEGWRGGDSLPSQDSLKPLGTKTFGRLVDIVLIYVEHVKESEAPGHSLNYGNSTLQSLQNGYCTKSLGLLMVF